MARLLSAQRRHCETVASGSSTGPKGVTIQQLANAIGFGEVIARMAMRGLAAAEIAATNRLCNFEVAGP
jgi:hypothetical protein